MDISGRVALVTGGSGDLGSRIVLALADAGCDVAVAYGNEVEPAKKVAAEVEAKGRRALVVQLNQMDDASCEAAISAAVQHFGKLEILVNNAAWNIGIPFPDIEALTPEIWDHVLDMNLRGPFVLCRAAARPMREQGFGRIINIASVAGLVAGGSSMAYACSKAGLIHLTKCLATALAPVVTVNCVAPGLIDGTRMTGRMTPEMVASSKRRAVLQRVASIDDITAQIVALLGYESVTGQTIVVDGGGYYH